MIDYDIPVPKRATPPPRPRLPAHPFAQMGVGGSFFAAGAKRLTIERQARAAGRDAGWRFRVREVTENDVAGVRCWRVK